LEYRRALKYISYFCVLNYSIRGGDFTPILDAYLDYDCVGLIIRDS